MHQPKRKTWQPRPNYRQHQLPDLQVPPDLGSSASHWQEVLPWFRKHDQWSKFTLQAAWWMQSLLASLCLQPKHQEASLHFTSQKVKIFHWKEHVGQFLKITLNFPKNSISLMKITGIGQGYMVKTKYPCLSFGTDSTASYTIFVPKKKMMTPKVLREFSFLNHVEVCAFTYHGTCIQVKNSPSEDHLVLGNF